jgi:hypothetical protein
MPSDLDGRETASGGRAPRGRGSGPKRLPDGRPAAAPHSRCRSSRPRSIERSGSRMAELLAYETSLRAAGAASQGRREAVTERRRQAGGSAAGAAPGGSAPRLMTPITSYVTRSHTGKKVTHNDAQRLPPDDKVTLRERRRRERAMARGIRGRSEAPYERRADVAQSAREKPAASAKNPCHTRTGTPMSKRAARRRTPGERPGRHGASGRMRGGARWERRRARRRREELRSGSAWRVRELGELPGSRLPGS